MMRKLYILFSLILLLSWNRAFCQEERSKIRVTVIPMINMDKDKCLNVITQTVTDTVSLYLKLIRKYRVFVEEDVDLYRDIDSLRQYAQEKEIDNIIFGKASLGTAREFVFEMSVYDRYKNSVTLTNSGERGAVYFVSDDANLYAPDKNGNLKWIYETEDAIYSSPTIGRHGNIYFGSKDCNLYALNPDGSLLWSFNTDGAIYSSPVVDMGETIYTTSWDGYLYAVDMEGNLNWKAYIGDRVSASSAIDTNGVLYIWNNEGILYAFIECFINS